MGVLSEMSISEARAALPQLLDRVSAGAEITITRHGKPVAVLVHPDSLRSRRADQAFTAAATVRDILEAGKNAQLSASSTLSEERAEALIAEIQAGRSAR